MIKAIIGRKAGMTQMFDEDGRVIPVTVIPTSIKARPVIVYSHEFGQ